MRTVLYSRGHSLIYLWPPGYDGLVAYKANALPSHLRAFLPTVYAPTSEYDASRSFRSPSDSAGDDGSIAPATQTTPLPGAARYRLLVPDRSHIETARTRFNVLAGVGVFGAGLSYSTFYTAKPTEALPGLTLMSWAYTAFLSCTFVSIVWQIVLTSGFPISNGPSYRSRAGIWSAIAASAISAYAGTVLLTLALTRHTSQAISAAAYTIVGASIVLVAGSAIRYYVTIRKTSRLPGRSPGFLQTMISQQALITDPIRVPSPRLSLPAPPAPTINDSAPFLLSAHAIDPDDAAALFFLQADDAYGGALRYIKTRCPAWRCVDVARQAELLMETIECFCVDPGACWLNPEHGQSDFEEFVRQAPRWTAAVDDLRREPWPSHALDYLEPAIQDRSRTVQGHQVRRLTKIFEEVEGRRRNGRDQGVQAPAR